MKSKTLLTLLALSLVLSSCQSAPPTSSTGEAEAAGVQNGQEAAEAETAVQAEETVVDTPDEDPYVGSPEGDTPYPDPYAAADEADDPYLDPYTELQEPVDCVPVEEFTDLTDAFSETEDTPLDPELTLYNLSSENLELGTYSLSEERFSLSGGDGQMAFQCTWVHSGTTCYIGLQNAETGEVYVVPFVGGSAYGTISLQELPEGEYQTVLFSNNNPECFAVMNYQIL